MDRLQVIVNGTPYTLQMCDVPENTWTLTGWQTGTQGTEQYFHADPATIGSGVQPGVLGIPYGTYIIMLENGMYINLQYDETYGAYSDYAQYSGLYNADGTAVGSVFGSAEEIPDLGMFGIRYTDNSDTYIGIAFTTGSEGYYNIFLFNQEIYDDSMVDPYDDGPEDPIQGGWGSWDRSTDGVGANATPGNLAPFNAGINMYVLNSGALASFTGMLWGSDESLFTALWSRFVNYRYNPIGAIIACHSLPTEFTPSGTTTTAIQLAGTALFPISGTLKRAATQFIDVSYNIDLDEFYGDFMDYTNTRIIVHLPFCGVAVLDPVYIVGGGLTVLYRCDVCTGNVTAFLICTNRAGRSELIQCAGGNAAYTVALTGHSDGMIEAVGSAVKTIAGGVATAMTGVPMSAGSGGDPMMQKESTTICGQMAGSSAVTSSLDLYLEIVYTEPSNPAGYTTLRGRPSDIGGTVGSFRGYTVFSDVHADGIGRATDDEKRMIEQMLKQGVII